MAVLRPLRVVIDNYPEGQVEEMEAVNNPEDASAGTRKVPFSKVLYIEQDDFREDPPKQYFRLSPGREVRLRYGYFITCTGVVKNDAGRGGGDPLHLRSGHARRQRARRAQGEIHHPLGLGRHMPSMPRCGSTTTCSPRRIPTRPRRARISRANLNPAFAGSADRLQAGAVAGATPRRASRYQFERLGYFCVDPDSRAGQAGLQPHRGAARYLGQNREAGKGRPNDHPRNRRHPGRCRQPPS